MSAIREYIGAKYVPTFEGEWDSSKAYDPLCVVMNQGNSYTSRQYVPVGVDIENETYWALSALYNAQIEQYKNEVDALGAIIPNTEFTSSNTVKDYIDTLTAQTQKCIVTIGDSFGDAADQGEANVWSVELAKRLNLELHNYCKGNAGYVRVGNGGNTFLTEIESANSDTSFDNDDVRYVIIYGGYNDAYNSVDTDTFKTNIATAITNVRQYFPKSELVIFGCNTTLNASLLTYGSGSYSKGKVLAYTEYIEDICSANGAQFCNTCGWLWGNENAYKSDYAHPNTLGRNLIVSQMLAFLNGQRISIPDIHWSQNNSKISYGSTWDKFVITEYRGLNPCEFDVRLEFECLTAHGNGSHSGGSVLSLDYARFVPFDIHVPVYKWNSTNSRWEDAGYLQRYENTLSFSKDSTDAINVGDKFRTGLIPFRWNYRTYTFSRS